MTLASAGLGDIGLGPTVLGSLGLTGPSAGGGTFNTLELDGLSQGASFPDSAAVTSSEISLCIWVYPLDPADTDNLIRNRSTGSAGTTPGFVLELKNGKISANCLWEDDAGNYRGMSPVAVGAITINQWQHIVMTCDSTDMKVYIDGVNIPFTQRVSGTVGSSNSGNITEIGSLAGSRVFRGSLTTPIIANRAYTQSEITTIYNAGFGIQPQDLPGAITANFIAAFPMNDGSPSPNDDVSGNGLDLTLIGSPTYTGEELEFTG